jgi:hypothetical protein
MSEERGIGVYCETKDFEGRYKNEKNVPISAAEPKALEIATNFIFQQDEQGLSYSLTRERHAKY